MSFQTQQHILLKDGLFENKIQFFQCAGLYRIYLTSFVKLNFIGSDAKEIKAYIIIPSTILYTETPRQTKILKTCKLGES